MHGWMIRNMMKQIKLSEIEDIVGTSDPDIAAARTSLDLEKMLGE